MQKNDLAYKQEIKVDGETIIGLVSCGEVAFEEGIIDVPEKDYIRKIKNGVTTIPLLELVYKVQKDSLTAKFFRDWKDKNQNKDVTIIDQDASGTEVSRTLYSDCECAKFTKPAYDASNPTYFSTAVTVVPYDVIVL